jgi:hypothetical protein
MNSLAEVPRSDIDFPCPACPIHLPPNADVQLFANLHLEPCHLCTFNSEILWKQIPHPEYFNNVHKTIPPAGVWVVEIQNGWLLEKEAKFLHNIKKRMNGRQSPQVDRAKEEKKSIGGR